MTLFQITHTVLMFLVQKVQKKNSFACSECGTFIHFLSLHAWLSMHIRALHHNRNSDFFTVTSIHHVFIATKTLSLLLQDDGGAEIMSSFGGLYRPPLVTQRQSPDLEVGYVTDMQCYYFL